MRQKTDLFPYTTQQVLSLAENEHFARSSLSMATAYRWLNLGQSDHAFWGEYPQKDKATITCYVALPDMQLHCSCEAKIFPCHHALALLLLFTEAAESFVTGPEPQWLSVKERQQTFSLPKHKGLDSVQREGLAALEAWLFDLAYEGLEQLRNQPYQFWFDMATRLVDARLAVLADAIRTWGQGLKQDNWSTELLAKMGKLQLLLEGFKHFDSLSLEIQTDLLLALGLKPAREAKACHDSWQVLGRSRSQSNSRKLERIWLSSATNGRFALVEKALLKPQQASTQLLTGHRFQGSLYFYQTSLGLRAELGRVERIAFIETLAFAQSSLEEALLTLAEQKAQNPWQEVFPLLLSQVWLLIEPDGWFLQDAQGHSLPVAAKFPGRWHLRGLSRSKGLTLFAEYQNQQLTPLAVFDGTRLLDMASLRGGG